MLSVFLMNKDVYIYEISVRSMNIDDRRPTTDLSAHSHILEPFKGP